MNQLKNKFKETFGPLLESNGYKFKFGVYNKIDSKNLLVKQVFPRITSSICFVGIRLATFYDSIDFKNPDKFPCPYFIELSAFEPNPENRVRACSYPVMSYEEARRMTTEQLNGIMQSAADKFMEFEYELFFNKAFMLLDEPQTLDEGCQAVKRMMMMCYGYWTYEKEYAMVQIYLKNEEEALRAIENAIMRFEDNKRRELTPKDNDARYNRMLNEKRDEWAQKWDKMAKEFYDLKDTIRNGDTKILDKAFRERVLYNAQKMATDRLITSRDLEMIKFEMQQ